MYTGWYNFVFLEDFWYGVTNILKLNVKMTLIASLFLINKTRMSKLRVLFITAL